MNSEEVKYVTDNDREMVTWSNHVQWMEHMQKLSFNLRDLCSDFLRISYALVLCV